MLNGLSLVQTQRMVLSPRLRQSLEVLQLPAADLLEEIRNAADENPLLEVEEHRPVPEEEGAPAAGPADTSEPPQQPPDDYPGASSRELDFGSRPWGEPEADDYVSPIDRAASPETLSGHLRSEASFLKCSEDLRDKVMFLIGELNDDGFLESPLEEIAGDYARLAGLDPEDEATWREALRLLRSLDPPGIGAYSQKEALILQMRSLAHEADDETGRLLAMAETAVSTSLQDLAKRDFARLKKALGCTNEDVRRVFSIITSLDPRPASRFRNDPVHQVIPDILVVREAEEWKAMLNPATTPALKLNPELYGFVKSGGAAGSSEWKARLSEARILIQSVEHRYETTLRVASAIVRRQQRFFSEGESGLEPMRLADIAAETSLHESTVSRATSGKYLQSPRGVFELKHLFSSHVSAEGGDQVSSKAVRAAIRKLVAGEDPTKPLSDGRISEELEKQGFRVARRTVAKYREQERIPAAPLRRRL